MAEIKIQPGETRIGWIGTGVMGASMCGHLIDKGFTATVYNRSKEKAAGLLEKGAAWADSPRGVADNSDVIFSIVGFPSDVRSVLLGEDGALGGCQSGNVLVDMTTSEPSLAIEIYEAAKAIGVGSVDAPVSGGIAGAAAATIALMFAGSKEHFVGLSYVLNTMSKNLFYVGTEPGQAQAMKLLNNYLSGLALTATSEAISFGLTQGLEMSTMLDVLNASSGQNTATSDKFPNRVLTESYDAEFLNSLYLKDISLYVDNVSVSGTSDTIATALLPIWHRFVGTEPDADFTKIFPFIRDKR